MMLFAACSAVWFGALMTPFTIPLTQENALPFFADADGKGGGDLMVIQGNQLEIYPNARAEKRRCMDLPPHTSAIDVADIDGNTFPEIIAIAGENVLRISLDPDAGHTPEPLFTLRTIYADSTGQPFPCPLVISDNDRPLLALPTENNLELRTPTGEIVETIPIGPESANRVSIGRPFSVSPVWTPRFGSDASLELRVSETQAFIPQLPAYLTPAAPLEVSHTRADIDMAHHAAGKAPEAWPWFSLNTGGGNPDERILYAFTEGKDRESILRVRRALPPERGGGKELHLSDPQHYSGWLIPPAQNPPDFNQDGKSDVIFWDTPNPLPTVGNLSKALSGGTWLLRLTVHLYDKSIGRISPKPMTRIAIDIPVHWFVDALNGEPPARRLALADFNGDGRTDIGFAIAPNRYALWVTSPTGLQDTPYQVMDLPGPIEDLVLQGDLEQKGRTTLVLRGKDAFYVLSARYPG